MLRTATFLSSRGLFNRLVNPGKIVSVTVKNPKKLLRRKKDMSTGCNEDPPLVCPREPCLMDYGCEPEGCWQEKYDRDNKKANKHLALGLASLIFSIFVMLRNGLVKGYDYNIFETDD